MRTIVTLKYGNKYSSDCVNTIYNMCENQFDRFVCFTDLTTGLNDNIDCLPIDGLGNWEKISLLHNSFDGDNLYLDLDVIVQGNLDPLFALCDEPTICETYWKNFGGEWNSSVMAWNKSNASHIPEYFFENYDYNLHKYNGKDDNFLYDENLFKRTFPKGLIYSFLGGVDVESDTSPRAHQIKPDYPVVLLNGQNEVNYNLRQKYYDALSLHKMG
jgi:hypothetical protein|tara:strand:+ start:417 stop:1061 length:645 start_codon:yes stop_codon:yes gene_type:complete